MMRLVQGLAVAMVLAASAIAGPPTFKDCRDCPEMVVIPAGSFVMGAPEDEPDRQAWDGPQRRVDIARPFALAKFETTRGQFAKFAAATHRKVGGPCSVFSGAWHVDPAADWRRPNFPQDDSHPVVCVDWYEALAYIEWLNTKGKHHYYLPSEAEFEYANRAGSAATFPWGMDRADVCRHANVADAQVKRHYPEVTAHDCDDGHEFTAPVGSYPPNAFGLYDTFGNVWEWVFDCWSFDHSRNPATGAPVAMSDHCERRVIKGSGYESVARYARSAARGRDEIPNVRIAVIGFRVAARLD
jgi:formylglycine-generating enzyme required for sulfatase activity